MPEPVDRHAVDRLVVEHLPAVLRVARRLSGDGDTAEELTQETLRRVLASWKSYRGDAPFKAWMMRVLVNVSRDRHRRRWTRREVSGEGVVEGLTNPAPGPVSQAVGGELSDVINQTIDALPDRQRHVATLYFGENLSAAEVAEVMEISTANVHSCLNLIRKRIAAAVGFEHAKRSPE